MWYSVSTSVLHIWQNLISPSTFVQYISISKDKFLHLSLDQIGFLFMLTLTYDPIQKLPLSETYVLHIGNW